MANSKIKTLQRKAVFSSLSSPAELKECIGRLAFVQADPIKAPAAAQDLILRQRVDSYRVGDLERLYPNLDIEEDFLYAYGFLSRELWALMHPRNKKGLSKLEKNVLAVVRESGQMHPRDLESHFGSERVVNAWGGYSKATKKALEDLHYRGLLRIARREKGIRVYEAANEVAFQNIDAPEKARKLVMVVSKIFQPLPFKSLKETMARVRQALAEACNTDLAIAELLRAGELCQEDVDGVSYIFCPELEEGEQEVSRSVRFLAPFDPIVWDRRRFEQFWGWAYRFEAYTPVAKRERGYYALPLLWGDSIIGWVNASVENGRLIVEPGFVGKRPREAAFRAEWDLEIDRFERFLKLKK